MSTHIEFDLKELRKIVKDKDSCVVEQNVKQNLALQPRSLGNIKGSIKTLLNYKIGKYDKQMFNGILLSYKNLHIHEVGSIRNDSPEVYYPVQADYFIFRPCVGATLKGVVNKKSPTHLGILVHRVFNVVIPNPTEEPDDKWIGGSVVEGQQIVFRIAFVDLYRALPYIRGELDEKWLNLDADANYEDLEMAQSLNVSYVHFDKTKPHTHNQMDDDVPEISSMNIQNNNISSKSKKRKFRSSDDATSEFSDDNESKSHKKVTLKQVSKEVTSKKEKRKEKTLKVKGPAAKKRKYETSDRSPEEFEDAQASEEMKVEDDDTMDVKQEKSVRKRKSRKAD